jgi:hypothetical protein
MPAVAHGAARWSPDDEAHLTRCDDCLREWKLVCRTAGLGSTLPAPDLDRIATAVLTALRTPQPSRSARLARWAVPLALAAGLLLVLVRTRDTTPTEPAAVTLSLLPEADALSDSELETVIQLIPMSEPNLGGVDSLSEDELNQMLKDLEG